MSGRDDDYRAPKRQRTDEGNTLVGGGDHDMSMDPHKTQPSQVVHIRGLSDYSTRQDVWECCEKFGRVAEVMLMSKKKQALVEFEDIQDAIRCVNYAKNSQVYVAGASAGFNFSTSQRIQRDKLTMQRDRDNGGHGAGGGGNMSHPANHILLFTIMDPIHPITVDVMKTICSPHGKVLRIVIFRKSGVQSMVEFDSVESAQTAMGSLQGQDIYTNCCTLRIEFAKAQRVNVRRNDPQESWDFTIVNEPEPRRNRPLLGDPNPSYNEAPPSRFSEPQGGYGGMSSGMSSTFRDLGDSPQKGRDDYGSMSRPSLGSGGRGGGYGNGRDYGDSFRSSGDRYGSMENESYSRFSERSPAPRSMYDQGGFEHRGGRPMLPDNNSYGRGPPMSDRSGGSVLMIYGLNMEKMNCLKLFNLLCLYGNVNRIKFLMKKEGSAMVELGDNLSVERAIQNLNNVSFHGNKMQVTKSKQENVQEVANPHKLQDGSSSYEDFTRSRNNRYTNPKNAEKNRIQCPSPVLHYFNAPPDMSEDDLKALFTNLGCEAPEKTKKFPQKSDRSSSGLIQFDSATTAVEGLVAANHENVDAPNGRSPFIFKLCFSSNQNID